MISVIITCYNLEQFLLEAVESVKAQTLQPQEIIIVHDGCKKPALVPGCEVVFREDNIGVARSRDEGFRISTGKLLLFLDADDALPENFLEETLYTIKSSSIAYPHILMWCHWSEKPKKNEMHAAPTKITEKTLLQSNQVTVTSLMSRDVYESVGGFDPELEIWEDWDFFIKALKKGFHFKRANTYIKYRQLASSRNHQPDKLKKQVYELIKKRHGKKEE